MIVTVVGAGVVGLSTAVALAERGHRVHVVAAEFPLETTSAVAGAIWGPYRAGPIADVDRWSAASLAMLTELAEQPGSGVRMLRGMEVAAREIEPPRWWAQLPDLRRCASADLPPAAVVGWRFTVPILDMPVYLEYLCERLAAAGGELTRSVVWSLAEAGDGQVVVNCTGAWARDLAADPALLPVRGQHVVVANPGLTEFFMADVGASEELIGVVPHEDRVILGGTAVAGSVDRGVDERAARAIVARCARIFPALESAPVLDHKIGIRPVRPRVRLARERLTTGRWCVHNYGHGGGGVSLAWGCALDAVHLVERCQR